MEPTNANAKKLADQEVTNYLKQAVEPKRSTGENALGFVTELLMPLGLTSTEAQAAFIGPKGMSRLKGTEFEKQMEAFTSRFFGQRAEINPPNSGLVAEMLGGGPYQVAAGHKAAKEAKEQLINAHYDSSPIAAYKAHHPEIVAKYEETNKHALRSYRSDTHFLNFLEKESKASADNIRSQMVGWERYLDKLEVENPVKPLVAADFLENFPSLVAAYPKLKRVPVEVNKTSGKAGEVAASFDAAHMTPYDITASNKVSQAFDAANPMPLSKDFTVDGKWDKVAQQEAYAAWQKRKNSMMSEYFKRSDAERNTGKMTLNLPETTAASRPTLDQYNSVLHEIQHFIQKEESGKSGVGFIEAYTRENRNRENFLKFALNNKATRAKITGAEHKLSGYEWNPSSGKDTPSKYFVYKQNPYEREAYESAERDINPQYRETFMRKLQEFIGKK